MSEMDSSPSQDDRLDMRFELERGRPPRIRDEIAADGRTFRYCGPELRWVRFEGGRPVFHRLVT